MFHTFVFEIIFSLLENAACQQSSVRIISGRTVCGFICASTSVPVGVAYYANRSFNRPIRAWGTSKETRRQRASASDWPAGPSQRSKSRTTHPICSRKSPAEMILNPLSRYILYCHTANLFGNSPRGRSCDSAHPKPGSKSSRRWRGKEKNKERKQGASVARVPVTRQ